MATVIVTTTLMMTMMATPGAWQNAPLCTTIANAGHHVCMSGISNHWNGTYLPTPSHCAAHVWTRGSNCQQFCSLFGASCAAAIQDEETSSDGASIKETELCLAWTSPANAEQPCWTSNGRQLCYCFKSNTTTTTNTTSTSIIAAPDGWYDGGEDQNCDVGCQRHGLICTE